jgi:L-Lysine epsilon oxidase N-terminal
VPPSLNEPDVATSSHAAYKDDQGRIKRQGARFRIYEYTHDDGDVLTEVREITAADAHIEWEVHLVNRKAAAPMFNGPHRRNVGVSESKLIIDTEAQKIAGAGQGMKRLQGFFMDSAVPLGDR